MGPSLSPQSWGFKLHFHFLLYSSYISHQQCDWGAKESKKAIIRHACATCVHKVCPYFNKRIWGQLVTAIPAGQCPSNFCFPRCHNQEIQASAALLQMRERELSKQSELWRVITILFSEIWILCCYNHLVSCSGSSLGWNGYTGFTGFVLDLKGEVTEVTRTPPHKIQIKPKPWIFSGLHRKIFQIRQMNQSITAADTKRKAQMQNFSNPRLRDSSFYTLSGPLCRAKVLRMKYLKKQKIPREFWKIISDYWSPESDELESLQKLFSGSFLPNLKNKIYTTET